VYVFPSLPVACHSGVTGVNDESGSLGPGSEKSYISPITPSSGIRSPRAVNKMKFPGWFGVAVRPIGASEPLMKSRNVSVDAS
jgi:hypothetical protein